MKDVGNMIWSKILPNFYTLYSATSGLLSFLDTQEFCFQLRRESLKFLMELIVKKWTPLLEMTFIKNN